MARLALIFLLCGCTATHETHGHAECNVKMTGPGEAHCDTKEASDRSVDAQVTN